MGAPGPEIRSTHETAHPLTGTHGLVPLIPPSMKIALGDVDSVTTKRPKMGYRIKVVKVHPEGESAGYAVVAQDRDRVVRNRTDLRMSQIFKIRAEAWSSFAHGFSVLDYGEVGEITELVDHLLASDLATEVE